MYIRCIVFTSYSAYLEATSALTGLCEYDVRTTIMMPSASHNLIVAFNLHSLTIKITVNQEYSNDVCTCT